MAKKLSIRQKLVIITVILIIYPMVVIGYTGYKNYAKAIKEKVIQYSWQSVNELSDLLMERTLKLNTFAQEMLYDDNIYVFDKQLKLQVCKDILSEYTFKEDFERYLKSILHSKSELKAVFFHFTANGKTYGVNKNFQAYNPPDLLIEDIYNSAKEQKGKPIWYFHEEYNNSIGIYLIKMVYDINSLEEIGVLAYKIDEGYLFDSFKDFAISKKQNISIYNDDYIKLFAFDSFSLASTSVDIKKMLNNNKQGIEEVFINHDTLYIIYKDVTPIDWKITVTISSNIFLEDVKKTAKKIAILCTLTLPLWMVVIYIMYFDIVKPTKILINTMKRVEDGEIGATVQIKRQDELGYVFDSFNNMSIEISNLINSVYKKQIALKDAQIKALQAQINPHFLYNTLETISWKAKLADLDEISEMIEAFAFIIDASLNRGNEREIPLFKEIEYIDNYAFLIQKRFGDRISIIKEIDSDTLDCIIPMLSIQPFIENAVYHGLENKKGGGHIYLKSGIQGYRLLMEVMDDGIGMSEEKLQLIKKYLDEDVDIEKEVQSNTHIGMINVHRRIRLMYGKEYGIDLSSHRGKGTCVTVILPFKK